MSIDIHALAGAYALDAVTDIERAEFARHVAVCASCAQEIAELAETAARLADASAVTPPARLKPAVLAAVARTRQLGPGGRPAEAARNRRGWRGRVAAAAAAVVIAVAGGAVGYRVGDDRAHSAAIEAQNARMTQLLTASDTRVHTERLGAAQVTVIASRRLDRGLAVLEDMPPLPDGEVYQLWLVHGDTPVSAGVMDPGVRTGTAFFDHVDGVTSFGVSAERTGGAAQPSLPLIMSFPLGT